MEANIRELLYRYLFDDRPSCLYAHIRAIRSARTVPPREPIDIPDWTKIQPGSVTQNWKHFTRDGDHGVTFREYGAINYAVSVIGAGRARAQNLVRALRVLSFAFISYVHVYAQGTPARDCPRLCYDRFARRVAPIRANDA